jgi:hypothetical protein
LPQHPPPSPPPHSCISAGTCSPPPHPPSQSEANNSTTARTIALVVGIAVAIQGAVAIAFLAVKALYGKGLKPKNQFSMKGV